MSAFAIKVIACISMCLSHIAAVFEAEISAVSPVLYLAMRAIGCMAFPLFAFGIAEGAVRTKNSKRYVLRMAVFAVIAQIPYMLMRGAAEPSFYITVLGRGVPIYGGLSVMVTLLLGLICCISIREGKHTWAALALPFALILSAYPGMDYGFFGVVFIMVLYFTREHRFVRVIAVALLCTFYYNTSIVELLGGIPTGISDADIVQLVSGPVRCLCMLFSVVFMTLYDGKRGRDIKWFTYVFYPAHMLLIWGLWAILKLA